MLTATTDSSVIDTEPLRPAADCSRQNEVDRA